MNKRKMKQNTGLFGYLEKHGYLNKGEEVLKLGKQEYRKKYLREHKQRSRISKKSHTVTFNRNEESVLAYSANRHGLKVAPYLKKAALAYSQKKFLMPKLEVIHETLQNIIFLRTQIASIAKEKKVGLFVKSKEEQIQALLQSLNDSVQKALLTPKDLEDELRETLIAKPDYANVLQELIREYAGEIVRSEV